MIKLLGILNFYNIELIDYQVLNSNLGYPVIKINEQYILKRITSEVPINEVLFDFLIRKNVLNNVIKNKYSRIFTYYDSCFWILTQSLEGTEYDYKNAHLLDIISEYLSSLSGIKYISNGIVFHDNFNVSQWYESSSKMLDTTFFLIEHYYGYIDLAYRKRIECLYQKIDFNTKYDRFLLGISHGELQNTNILFSSEGLKVFDWDSLSLRPRIFDIATSACYFCREKRGEFNLDIEKFNKYLSGFSLDELELANLMNMIFICFIPKEDTIEKFYVKGKVALAWYLEWTISAMESIFSTLLI